VFDVRRIVEDRLVVLVANAGVSKLASVRKRRCRISTACSRSMSGRRISHPADFCDPRLGSSPVFLTSAAAHAAVTNLSVYAATKGAVETVVRHLPSSSASTAPVCGTVPCPPARQ
jgi:3-oxoacyl-[acyl-carrier protein] reductase